MSAVAIVMRAQPPHHGHFSLIRAGLAMADRALIFLGSSFHARTPRNPFNEAERARMIQLGLTAEEWARVDVIPVRDYYNNDRWAATVRAEAERRAQPRAQMTILGHHKDATSAYLRDFPGWTTELVGRQGAYDATTIRNAIYGAKNVAAALAAVEDMVPPTVMEFLLAHARRPEWEGLREEAAFYAAETKSWGTTPFTHFVLCADAIVTWRGQVALIERADAPGRGLLAMPGGHVETFEQTQPASMRELIEEVGIGLHEDELRHAMVGHPKLLEHPSRSERPGRIISMAYRYDLRTATRPSLRSGSDAKKADWHDISTLAARESTFFEDHFMALDDAFDLTADKISTPG